MQNGGEVVLDLETARNINDVEGYGRYCVDCGRVTGTCDCAYTYAPLDNGVGFFRHIDCE